MKTKVLFIVSLVLVAGVTAITLPMCSTQDQDCPVPPSESLHNEKFTLNTALPSVNESYAVYQTVIPDVSDEYVNKIGEKFGIQGEPQKKSESTGRIQILDNTGKESRCLLVYEHSGGIVYEIPEKAFPASVESQPVLPSNEEAKKIATDFLKKRDLLPEDAEIESVKVDKIYKEYKVGCKEPVLSYDMTLDVHYSRDFSGISVYGDELSVIIGDKGEVVEVIKSWRDVQPYRDVKIKTPNQAYSDLIASKFARPPAEALFEKVIVENITLGYWMEPRISEQKYVLPVYVFSGTGTVNGEEMPYVEFVPAVLSEEMTALE
ncbi:hypothetical protein J2129_000530 [Methanofollis sp. W23]|uniref:calcium-dependent protein kinase n=1 Tax=Methanofollis sp. W23 TaxID=2817849 RepID=UPI001AE8311E|nr:calcium-dependent protein kinase [Methanofollis sp. W23]MBP2145076.1 hypothetical protein [Methanofollis sp. W23]